MLVKFAMQMERAMKRTMKKGKAKTEKPLSAKDLDQIVGGTAQTAEPLSRTQEEEDKSLEFGPPRRQQASLTSMSSDS